MFNKNGGVFSKIGGVFNKNEGVNKVYLHVMLSESVTTVMSNSVDTVISLE